MKYKKNTLTTVVLRLDFPQAASLLIDKQTPLTEVLKPKYPVVSANQAATIRFNLGVAGGSGIEQKAGGWTWTHANEKGTRKIILTPESLAIEYGAGEYIDFNEFQAEFGLAYEATVKNLGITSFTRVGLRYIDTIDLKGDPLDWKGIVAEDLATTVKAGCAEKMQLTRSMHQLIGTTDDMTVIFNYGMHNPDYPSPVARRLFILDYDVSVSGTTAPADIPAKLTAMHDVCGKMYEASIGDGLRAIMEVEHA